MFVNYRRGFYRGEAWAYRGEAWAKKGEFNKAIDDYYLLIKKHPYSTHKVECQTRIASLFAEAGDYYSALRWQIAIIMSNNNDTLILARSKEAYKRYKVEAYLQVESKSEKTDSRKYCYWNIDMMQRPRSQHPIQLKNLYEARERLTYSCPTSSFWSRLCKLVYYTRSAFSQIVFPDSSTFDSIDEYEYLYLGFVWYFKDFDKSIDYLTAAIRLNSKK